MTEQIQLVQEIQKAGRFNAAAPDPKTREGKYLTFSLGGEDSDPSAQT